MNQARISNNDETKFNPTERKNQILIKKGVIYVYRFGLGQFIICWIKDAGIGGLSGEVNRSSYIV